MRLTHIELVFENVEVMRFAARDIEHFSMTGVTGGCLLWNHNNSAEENNIHWTNKCANIQLILNSRANNMENWVSDYPSKGMPFGRIAKYRDITHVELRYAGGRKVSYEVDWVYVDKESFNPENRLQKTRLGPHGQLYIWIGKDLVKEEEKNEIRS